LRDRVPTATWYPVQKPDSISVYRETSALSSDEKAKPV